MITWISTLRGSFLPLKKVMGGYIIRKRQKRVGPNYQQLPTKNTTPRPKILFFIFWRASPSVQAIPHRNTYKHAHTFEKSSDVFSLGTISKKWHEKKACDVKKCLWGIKYFIYLTHNLLIHDLVRYVSLSVSKLLEVSE